MWKCVYLICSCDGQMLLVLCTPLLGPEQLVQLLHFHVPLQFSFSPDFCDAVSPSPLCTLLTLSSIHFTSSLSSVHSTDAAVQCRGWPHFGSFPFQHLPIHFREPWALMSDLSKMELTVSIPPQPSHTSPQWSLLGWIEATSPSQSSSLRSL